MDAKIVAVGLVGATVGLFFLNRWLVRRANRKYDAEVAALTARIRAKEVARVEAELIALIRKGVPRMPKLDLTVPLRDVARAGARVKLAPLPLPAWPTPTAAPRQKVPAIPQPAPERARPANAYDARKAEVRHQHESAARSPTGRPAPAPQIPQPAPIYDNFFGFPVVIDTDLSATEIRIVSGSGGTFDGGGTSGDWSSPSTDSGSSPDSGSSSASSD